MIVFRALLESSKNEQTEPLTSILKSAVFNQLFHDGWNPYSMGIMPIYMPICHHLSPLSTARFGALYRESACTRPRRRESQAPPAPGPLRGPRVLTRCNFLSPSPCIYHRPSWPGCAFLTGGPDINLGNRWVFSPRFQKSMDDDDKIYDEKWKNYD